MLFSAGMGIGLMFFGVAEPISHLSAPLHGSASSRVQTKEAMLNTLFHWGIPCLGNLTIDNAYFSRKLSESTVYWDGSHWQDRLKKIVSVGTLDDFQQFLKQTVDPAFQELRQEFLRNGISVHIQGSDDSQTACRELIVESGSLRNFIYGIRYRANDVSDTVVGSLSFPTITEEENYEPICYFADGRRGYSIKYMQKDELITDVLRQYERYVKMLAAGKHDLYLTDKVHPGQGGKS